MVSFKSTACPIASVKRLFPHRRGGYARMPLSPGKHIADGVSAAESGAIDIAAGISAELNDQVVAGRVAVNAGDRLCAGGVEVSFITVDF